jgi:hypothetical protein
MERRTDMTLVVVILLIVWLFLLDDPGETQSRA